MPERGMLLHLRHRVHQRAGHVEDQRSIGDAHEGPAEARGAAHDLPRHAPRRLERAQALLWLFLAEGLLARARVRRHADGPAHRAPAAAPRRGPPQGRAELPLHHEHALEGGLLPPAPGQRTLLLSLALQIAHEAGSEYARECGNADVPEDDAKEVDHLSCKCILCDWEVAGDVHQAVLQACQDIAVPVCHACFALPVPGPNTVLVLCEVEKRAVHVPSDSQRNSAFCKWAAVEPSDGRKNAARGHNCF
mmetsp:Transcript_65428/g.185566  ORF Transcript_65428/g.185566 Transcript_65428/m.185566 type:complete len:249 (+) Transcript_65428:661-1407(+)